MQKLSGNGIVFLEFDGSIIEYDLAAGQEMVLDTGHLAAMEDTCTGENIYTDYASLISQDFWHRICLLNRQMRQKDL